MKKLLFKAVLLFSLISFLNSCATDRSIAQRISDYENTVADDPVCFIQRNDGTIQNFTTLKLVTGVFTSPHLLADGQVKIKPEEIKAYQNQDHYAVSQKLLVSGKQSHVARETLPGFAIRVVKGKVNVYCKKFYNGERAVNEYYLQPGEEGQIKLYSPQLMNEIVKNDAAAYNYFNSKTVKEHMPQKLLAAVQLYNNNQMVSRN